MSAGDTIELPLLGVAAPAIDPDLPCLLDGRIQRLAEARVHPLDRGFLFGDALYEVIEVWDGRPLFLAEHLARLEHGLASVEIPLPADLVAGVDSLLRAIGGGDGALYLQVTRGVAPRQAIPPAGLRPTLFAMPLSHRRRPLGAGLSAVTMEDPRWSRCDVKTTSLMGTVLGKLRARTAGVDEVVFVGPDGSLREGGNVGLFCVPAAGDGLWVPPLAPQILPSVTREVVAAEAAAEGLAIHAEAPRMATRAAWRELVAVGTLTAVQAITRLDGQPVGDGRPGPWAQRLAALLERAKCRALAGGAR